MRALYIGLGISIWLFAQPQIARGVGLPAPGAVTPQTVKVPDGPGSVRGLASDASVSSFTGQVAYEIPIELPGGPGGLAPKLALHYNGALGNGPLGIGWSLGQVGIRRSLRLGVPSYNSSDELELVGLAGGTLVPIGGGQYRAEGQGNSIRGVAVDGGFELVDSAGTRYRIGTSEASRLSSGSLVAAWYVERVTDVAGHVIDYSYERQNGELYVTAISWGGNNVFRAELVYGTRPDAVVSWRTGFRILTGRRLTQIKLWSFEAVRHTVELTYDQTFALSRLATVRVVGPDGVASPTTTLGYASVAAGQVQSLGNTGGWNLGNSAVSFFDVDKDGAMDLLRIESGNHRYRRNLGRSFGPEIALSGASALAMSSVRMLDLDGDSGAEMVTRSGSTWQSFRLVNNAWVGTVWPGSSTLDLPNVAVADLNGDSRMDVLTVSGSGIAVWFGTANGFGAPRTLPAVSPGEPSITPLTAQFHDLNGDGLADAIAVNSNGLIELRGRGDGTFERVGPIAYPWTGTTDTTQVRLADLDRDGILDIVRVGATQVSWHRGKPDGTFSAQATRVLNRPAGADSNTVVALADANGNGSTDVVWSSPSGMWALDLAGPTNAGLLVAIANGLGKTQRFAYTASAQLAWAAEQASDAWTQRMPVSIAVATTATQVLDSGDPDRVSLLAVRDGIYEHVERRFIGFSQSIQTFPGATARETIRVTTQYHAGRGADRALRGQVLTSRTEDGEGRVFKQVDNQVVALAIDGLPDDPRLRRAAITQTDVTSSEPGEPSAVVRTRFAFDGEGRMIEERRDGRVGGSVLDGDESILRRTYTGEDAVTGVRDLVCEESLFDGADALVSKTQKRYGDASTVAAPCQPGKGWVREELGYLAVEDRWVTSKATSYNTHGSPIVVLANGVARTLAYDASGVYVTSESVSPAAGKTLSWTAAYDNVAGTLIKVTAPNGTSTRMTYDGIGRLTSIAANHAPAHLHYRYHWDGPRPRTETFLFDGDPAALGALPEPWTPSSGWRHAVSIANGAGEVIATATRLDIDQWNIGEYRWRDARGRVVARTTAFAFIGSDPAAVIAPGDTPAQTLVYDPLDRVIDEVLPTGAHKRVTYRPAAVTVAIDGLATVETKIDGQGRTTRTERTVSGIVESVDAVYDAAGRIKQFSLQGGQVVHQFTYDSLGRLVFASDPEGGPRTMQYDDAGRLEHSVNAAGQDIAYSYDGAGRLLTVDGAGVTARYHYDTARAAGFANTAGLLAWAEEPTGSVDFGYDDQGRPMIVQRTLVDGATTIIGREVTQLAPSGLTRSVDLGDGVVVPVRYDAAGRVNDVTGVWSVASYSAGGMALHEQFSNGVVQRYLRDVLDRPTQITVENGGGALYRTTASYNDFGAIAALTDVDGVGLDHTGSFAFDGAGRLTAATIGAAPNGYQFTYAYDGLQNMVQRTAQGLTELGILTGTYQYRALAPRQLAQVVGSSGAATVFAYDAAGRQTQHGAKTLAYNAMSQLTRVDDAAGSVEHRYGYDGSRVATRAASGEMTYFITPNVVVRGAERDHYVRVGSRLIAKITTSDPVAVGETHGQLGVAGVTGIAGTSLFAILALAGGGRRKRRTLGAVLAASLAVLTVVASCSPGLSTQTSALGATSTSYFHATYSAGPSLTTGAAGELVEERRTEPFGAPIDALRDGVVQAVDYRRDPVNALNKLTDPDTGWSYHGARWLAPDTAQWHTPDPPTTAPDAKFMTTPWSLHPYQYVEQNPIEYWDPDGREPRAVACEAPSCALAVAIDAKAARNDRLVSAAEALVGKLTWSGPSFPASDQQWQISTKSERLKDNLSGQYTTTNDFARWVRGGPAPTESSSMNCWEAVMFAGYKSGVISKNWITSVHADATFAARSDHTMAAYHDVLKKRLGFAHAAKLKPGTSVERGDLVFFDGLNHVAVATGKQIHSGGVVKHEVISLWILPGQSNGHLYSHMQRTTIEDIQENVAKRMGAPIKEVRVGSNPW